MSFIPPIVSNDPNASTQPYIPKDSLARTGAYSILKADQKKKRAGCCGCLPTGVLFAILAICAIYFLFPLRTNLLVLGTDRTSGTNIGRSDTNIMLTIIPLKPYVGMLSIPRDLWVPIPGHGENRINTAHFYAELDHPGSGPSVAAAVFSQTFHVKLPYYIAIQFDGFKEIVNAMGGLDIELSSPASGLSAGPHHLDGDQALAFARERESSDDFFRMSHGQFIIQSIFKQMLKPANWSKFPAVAVAAGQVVKTNLPIWLWPRLGLAVLRAGPGGIDSQTITREMVTPFVTTGGADVLAPNWDKINPAVQAMFGK
jgi:polyisoprenyl-teichoic acid--peptidoglycan teichoic acid transferase